MSHPQIDLTYEKQRLRKLARARRALLKHAVGQEGEARAVDAAFELIAGREHGPVSGFFSYDSEIDCTALLAALSRTGVATGLPVVEAEGKPLVFRAWQPGDEMEAGAYDIPVPRPSAGNIDPDIVLVPLLAFDAGGMRLGYGGGFYDRTLESLRAARKTLAIGLAFSGQEVEEVPAGPHDVPLDFVVTENGVRTFL